MAEPKRDSKDVEEVLAYADARGSAGFKILAAEVRRLRTMVLDLEEEVRQAYEQIG